MLYKEELNDVYRKYYTELTADGHRRCKYYEECKAGMCAEYGYDSSLAMLVGDKYGSFAADGVPLRILIIGQEHPGGGLNQLDTPSQEARNPHYKRTLLTLMKVFGVEDVENMADTWNVIKGYSRLYRYYALTNYYRCAFKENAGDRVRFPHNETQDKRCAEILFDEIKAIKPNIIIKQGKFAWKEFDTQCAVDFPGYISTCVYDGQKKNGINISAYQYEKENDRFCVIFGYHPTTQNPVWSKHKATLFEAIDAVKQNLGINTETNYFQLFVNDTN